MNIDFDVLINQQLEDLYGAVDACGVDLDTFKAHSLSCVMGYGWDEYGEGFEEDGGASRGVTLAEELGMPEEEATTYRSDFNALCELAPIVPRSVFGLLGLSYSNLIAIRDETRGFDNPQRKIEGLVHASYGRGQAMGILEKVELQLAESQRKTFLSRAGEKGALSKNLRTQNLKSWAIQKAMHMRGSDMDIARQLAAQLPPELADVSKDPERLIYDALRSRRKQMQSD